MDFLIHILLAQCLPSQGQESRTTEEFLPWTKTLQRLEIHNDYSSLTADGDYHEDVAAALEQLGENCLTHLPQPIVLVVDGSKYGSV